MGRDMNRAFFLDRDGTINVDYNFVHTPEEWTWCEGAVEAIRQLNEVGYKVIVVTNQSGISRGRYTESDVRQLHKWVDLQLQQAGARIDEWYLAAHHPRFDPPPHKFSPEDRKPGSGMFLKAARKHDIDLKNSLMAGDKISDLKPALNLGMTPCFIRSRHEPNQDKKWLSHRKIDTYNRLLDVVEKVI